MKLPLLWKTDVEQLDSFMYIQYILRQTRKCKTGIEWKITNASTVWEIVTPKTQFERHFDYFRVYS